MQHKSQLMRQHSIGLVTMRQHGMRRRMRQHSMRAMRLRQHSKKQHSMMMRIHEDVSGSKSNTDSVQQYAVGQRESENE